MKDQVIVRVVVKILIPFILIFGFYLMTHGEQGPGGGFQGGIVLASTYILYCLLFDIDQAKRAVPERVVEAVSVTGILVYVFLGLWSVFRSGAFLDYRMINPQASIAFETLVMNLIEFGIGVTVCAVIMAIVNQIAGKSPDG